MSLARLFGTETGVGEPHQGPVILWSQFDLDFNIDDDIYAGGAGIRYLMVRLLGMHAGIDVAFGPEEAVVYLVFGSGWQM